MTRAHAETIAGRASVIDGDTLEIAGKQIRLLGIDAPESSQTCTDSRGSRYRCGQRLLWLTRLAPAQSPASDTTQIGLAVRPPSAHNEALT